MKTSQFFSISRVLTAAIMAMCVCFVTSCGSDGDDVEGPDPGSKPAGGYFCKYNPFMPCTEWGCDTLNVFTYMKTYRDFQNWGKPYLHGYDGGGGFGCTYHTLRFYPEGVCVGYGFNAAGLRYAAITYEWSDDNDWQTLLGWTMKQYNIQEWDDIQEQWNAHRGFGYAGGQKCSFYLSIDKGGMDIVIEPVEK